MSNTPYSAPREENPNCTQVRNAWWQKVIIAGLVLAFLLFATAAPAYAANVDIQNGVCGGTSGSITATPDSKSCGNIGDQNTKVNNLARDIVEILSVVVGFVAVVMLIIGGFRYITSGGSSDKISSAKNTIIYALIGLVIVAMAQIIVQFVLHKAGCTNGTYTSGSKKGQCKP